MLTGTGRWVAAVGVALLVTGVVTDYPEVLALGLTCVVALVGASLWMLQRPDLDVVREISPQRVQEGDTALGILTLTNRRRRRSLPIVAQEKVGDHTVAVTVPSLPPGGATSLSYPLPTRRRGVYEVGPLTIGQADPLRLMRVARSFASRSVLWVHPGVDRVSALPTGTTRDMDGPTNDSSPRGGIAFHSLREYVPGDDRRLIHWPSSARFSTLLVRSQVIPNEPRLMLVLDTSTSPYADDSFEDAVRVAASLAAAAWTSKYPLEVCTTGGGRATCTGAEGDLLSVLDLLAQVQPAQDDPGLSALVAHAPDEEGVSLGVVTGQVEADQSAVIGRMRNRFAMISVVMVGERYERLPPRLPGVLALNVADSAEFVRAWQTLVPR